MTQSNLPAESSTPEHLRFGDRCSCGHLRGEHSPQTREYQDCEKCGCEHFVLRLPIPPVAAPVVKAALPWELGEDGLPVMDITDEDKVEAEAYCKVPGMEAVYRAGLIATRRQFRELIQHIQEGK